jgi:UDP-N-acetylmuramate--alanine ligase
MNNKVHFIGIGGIGTSALARWFLAHNCEVSGSDAAVSETTSDLKNQGVKVFISHRPENLPKTANLAIFSAAVPLSNPEVQKAKELGIPVKSYAEALGNLTKQYKTIAVSGAHGKSTTTALLSLVLIKAGIDPTVIIGTKLKEFNERNFRNGKSNWLVMEADEYHKSFLNYSPFAAIITNIDREHLDYYKNLAEIKNVFLEFIKNIQVGGILVVNKDDKNLFNLKNKIEKIAKNNNLELYWYSITLDRRSQAQCNKIKKILKIPGEHNVSNALGVYCLAKALKIKDKDIFGALDSYRGAWRRMEHRGELKIKNQKSKIKIKVYDDYAHHPTEIKAALSGFRQKYSKSKIICVFQPHQAKRLSLLFEDFVRAFDEADVLILLPVYQVSGRDISDKALPVAKYLSQKLAHTIKERTNKPKIEKLKIIIYLPDPKKLPHILQKLLLSLRESALSPRQSAIVVMMGAGDIYKYTPLLLSSDSKRKS